jgi:hypothetical protein
MGPTNFTARRDDSQTLAKHCQGFNGQIKVTPFTGVVLPGEFEEIRHRNADREKKAKPSRGVARCQALPNVVLI